MPGIISYGSIRTKNDPFYPEAWHITIGGLRGKKIAESQKPQERNCIDRTEYPSQTPNPSNIGISKMSFRGGWLLTFGLVFFCLAPLLFGQKAEKDSSASGEFNRFMGTWTGHGAGEEVRFRDKGGLLVLTVKHKTEFVFEVDQKGNIVGEGSIEYNVERNTSGLDNLVAGVHALMGLAQVPSIGVKGPKGEAAQKVGEHATDVAGVTKIQYEAPHLKYGPEVRHFKFTGRVHKGTVKDKAGLETDAYLITLDEVLNFARIGGKSDSTLVVEYEVNRVKTQATFPCWSPFIEGTGVIRQGPGRIHIAEFQQEGKHRKGKKVWEEYAYIWLARQVAK